MQVVRDKSIPLTLQLIKSDLTYEDEATVKYTIYNSNFSTIEVSETETTWNDTLKCYTGSLTPSADWIGQTTGNYILLWSISDTDFFASVMTEELIVVEDTESDLGDIEGKIDIIDINVDTINTTTQAVSATANDIEGKVDIINTIVSDIDTTTQSISATANDIEDKVDIIDNNVDTINTNVSNIDTKINTIDTNVDTLNDDMKRALGLMHENIYIDNAGYDSNNNLVSARVRIYSNPASVGTGANVIGTYTITSVGSGTGKFSTWQQVKS